MRRCWGEIDPEIAYMLLMMFPLTCLSWWMLPVPMLVPQGRICARVFWDYHSFGRSTWPYLVANEVFVFASVGLMSVAQVGFTTVRE